MDPNATSPRARYLAIRVVFIAFLAGIVTLAIWSLPGGYSADLSQVGQAGTSWSRCTINLVSSTALMDSLNRVRVTTGVIEFVVAHAGRRRPASPGPPGRGATLLLFGPDGTRLGWCRSAHDPATLRES